MSKPPETWSHLFLTTTNIVAAILPLKFTHALHGKRAGIAMSHNHVHVMQTAFFYGDAWDCEIRSCSSELVEHDVVIVLSHNFSVVSIFGENCSYFSLASKYGKRYFGIDG